jgi:hypothetical protein
MTKNTAARVARMIAQAEQAGWTVTREVDDGMEFVSFDGGFYTDRFMVGSQVENGGRTFAVRTVASPSSPNIHVTLRHIEMRLAWAAAAATV